MNIVTHPKSRLLLVQSLDRVAERRDEIGARLARSLARSAHDPELSNQPQLVAAVLLDILIDEARHAVADGDGGDFASHAAEHRAHGIKGRHYSRFGDALGPILKDVLGPQYPRATAAAWVHLFWALVRRLQAPVFVPSLLRPATTWAEAASRSYK